MEMLMARSRKEKNTKSIKPFDEQDTKLARGIVRKVEDIKKLSPEEQVRGMEIIRKTSRGLSRDRRMENFFKDLYDD